MSLNFSFDYFNQFELPPIWLTNPDGTQLYMLGSISDRQLKLRFNALSEFSFIAQKFIDDIENDYYDYLDYRRIVNIENIGNFMIETIEETNDGIVQEKKIICKSLECELGFKKLSLFKGTYNFHKTFSRDEGPNSDPVLLDYILQYIPGWTIGYVDPVLNNISRTFDISDTTIYSFLMNQVSQAYQCIFSFDTINKIINVYGFYLDPNINKMSSTATRNTNIFLSYQNLVDQVSIKEITEELVTALNVFGGGNLSIRQVNPMGTDTIYDFSYYKNTNWMSGSLITAITNWENTMISNQREYADTLTLIYGYDSNLLELQSQLATLQGELTVLEEVLTVRIREGIKLPSTDPGSIAYQNALVVAKRQEIQTKQTQIQYQENIINYQNFKLNNIHREVSFEYNFTPDQIIELNNFIIGNTYTNENFIMTDIMTPNEIQDQAQQLYNQGQQVLSKVSEPRYMFEVNSVNFIFLKEFQKFIDQLVLGAVVTVEFDNGNFAYPILLGMDFSYDDPNNFKIFFSNRLRLDDANFQFGDLFNQAIDSGITSAFNSEIWSSWNNNYKNDVSNFINSSLNVAKNSVTSATNQNFIIDSNGFRGRLLLNAENNTFDDKQFWMINNMLAFTKDNWNNAELALGDVTWQSGIDSVSGDPIYNSAYGLVADVIVGHLVASNSLLVENENKSFSMDGNGARLYNASLTIQQGNYQILLRADKGIEIARKDPFGLFTDKRFYVDPVTGDVVFAGNLQAASGTFSGTIIANRGKIGAWDIDDFGLKDIFGNYIYGNGKIRLGALTIDGAEAWFHGTFYANNLNQGDRFQGYQLANINADTITAGTIRGINIFGSNISWPGVRMYSPVSGFSVLESSQNIAMVALNGGITMNSNSYANLVSRGDIAISSDTTIHLDGSIKTTDSYNARGTGISESFVFTTSSGCQVMNFINGILCSATSGSTSGSDGGGGGGGGGEGGGGEGGGSGSSISGSSISFDFSDSAQGWVGTQFGGISQTRWIPSYLESYKHQEPAIDATWTYTPGETWTISASTVFYYKITFTDAVSIYFEAHTTSGDKVIYGQTLSGFPDDTLIDTNTPFGIYAGQVIQYITIHTTTPQYGAINANTRLKSLIINDLSIV